MIQNNIALLSMIDITLQRGIYTILELV